MDSHFFRFVGVICPHCRKPFDSLDEVAQQGTMVDGKLMHRACNEKRITNTVETVKAGEVKSRVNMNWPGTPVWDECYHRDAIEATIAIVRKLDQKYPGCWQYDPSKGVFNPLGALLGDRILARIEA